MELLKLKDVINKMNYSEGQNSSYNYISRDSMLNNLGFDNIGDFKKYNPVFLRKNKLVNANEDKIINVGKVLNGNNYIFSFKDLSKHLMIIDESKYMLKHLTIEMFKKNAKIFGLINEENVFYELKNFCKENNLTKYKFENKICFSIKYKKEFLIKIFDCFVRKDFKQLNQNFVENYFENYKKITIKDNIYFSKTFIKELIKHIENDIEKVLFNKIYVHYLLELKNGLKNIEPYFEEEYNENIDFSQKIKNKDNYFLLCNNKKINNIINVVSVFNTIEMLSSKNDDEDINLITEKKTNQEQYFLFMPSSNFNDENIYYMAFAQSRAIGKSIIIYSNYTNEKTSIISNHCFNYIIEIPQHDYIVSSGVEKKIINKNF